MAAAFVRAGYFGIQLDAKHVELLQSRLHVRFHTTSAEAAHVVQLAYRFEDWQTAQELTGGGSSSAISRVHA